MDRFQHSIYLEPVFGRWPESWAIGILDVFGKPVATQVYESEAEVTQAAERLRAEGVSLLVWRL